MSKRKSWILYIFIIAIPAVSVFILSGILYNAMIVHQASLWRTAVGSFLTAFALLAMVGILQRPIRIIHDKTTAKLIRWATTPIVANSKLKVFFLWLFNFIVIYLMTYIVRALLSYPHIVGRASGLLMATIFISISIGAYAGFDELTIDHDVDVSNV